MEAVNSIGNAELCVEQSLNLFFASKIGLAGDDMLSALGGLGFDNVSEDEVNVGSLGVGEELAGKLKMDLSVVNGCTERGEALTIPPSHPAAPVMRTTLLWPETDPLTAVMVCTFRVSLFGIRQALRATVADETIIYKRK